MENAIIEKAQTSKTRKFSIPLISLVGLLLCVMLVWGLSTSWWTVRSERVKFVYAAGESQYTGSYVLMTPKSASKDNPVPCVILFHGGSSNAFSMKNYGIELTKRGYAILLLDMPAAGFSSMIGQVAFGEYQDYMDQIVKHVQAMEFVDRENVLSVGFSAGIRFSTQLATQNPGFISGVIHLTSGDAKQGAQCTAIGVNYGGTIYAVDSADRAANEGELVGTGSWDDGSGNYIYYTTRGYSHRLTAVEGELVTSFLNYCEWFTGVSSIPNDQLNFGWCDFFSFLAFICLFAFLASFVLALLNLEFFKTLCQEKRPYFNPIYTYIKKPVPSKIVKVLQKLIIPVFSTLILFEIFGARWQPISRGEGLRGIGLWFNVYLPFLGAIAVFNILYFLFFHFKYGKKQGGNLLSYGLKWQGTSAFNLRNLGKCFVLGCYVIFIFASFTLMLDSFMGINLTTVIFSLNAVNIEHFIQIPFYFLFYILVLGAASLNSYIASSYVDTGNNRRDAWVSTIIATGLAILPYVMLIIWNYCVDMGIIKLLGSYNMQTQFGLAGSLYSYPFMIGLTTPVLNIIYRKTRSIWPGVIICALLIALMLCGNFALQKTWLG